MDNTEARKSEEGKLEIEGIGFLCGGKLFSRVNGKTNDESPEYIAGKLAQKLGHEHGSRVRYKVIVYQN